MKKLSAPVIKGVQFHHQREKESTTNRDIDYTKSHLNYDVVNSKLINFNQEVKKVISENVKSNRAVRKDAVVLCDFVITSDKSFFNGLSQEEQNRYFKKSCEFFQDRYGKDKVVYGKIHLDEHTPHMHLGLVPITQEGKLSAKTLFDRKGLRNLQNDYPKYMQQHGFEIERGEPKENVTRLETQEYKKQQAKELAEKLDNEMNAIKTLQNDLERTRLTLYNLEHLEVKKSFLGGKITISEDAFKKLMDMAKEDVINSTELNKLKKEVETLKLDNGVLKNSYDKSSRLSSKLWEETHTLKGDLKKLKDQGKAMYEVLKKHDLIPEAKQELQTIKKVEEQSQKLNRRSKSMDWER
jgi:hypothetical protein